MSTPLVLAWHGTANPAGPPTIASITARVRRLVGVPVHTAWVDAEAAGPAGRGDALPDVLARVGDCVLVPCFLAAGYHVTHDVPDAAASAPGRVRVTPHLGARLGGVLRRRVAEAGGPGDHVVLAVVGSRRADARAEVDAVASALAADLGVGVEVADLFGGDQVGQAVRRAHDRGASDVLVAPWTIAPGRWRERLQGLAGPAPSPRVRVADPLGDHPDVAGTIAAHHRAALVVAGTSLDA